MTRTRCAWISLLLLSGLPLWTVGAPGFPGAPRAPGSLEDSLLGPPGSGPRSSRSSRAGFYARRVARSVDAAAAARCSELAPPWQENRAPVPEDPPGFLLQLRVRVPGPEAPPGSVFPGAPLLGFVRRVYRCCEQGQSCRSLRGVQGRRTADADVEFLLSREISSVQRAELHLQLSNPQQLELLPVLPSLAKRHLPTRFSSGTRGSFLELQVDVLSLLRGLGPGPGPAPGGPSLLRLGREPAAAASSRGPELELGLVLGCSRAGVPAPCGPQLQLLHAPFLALYHR